MIKETIIKLRSQTHALKAKRLLSAVGIQARVVKAGAEPSSKGCGYGIAVSAHLGERCAALLREKGIPPIRLLGSGE